MFKRSARLAVAHILIEKQIRQSRNDQHVGGPRRKHFGDAPDEFRELKTGKGACDANETVELGWFKTALSGKPGDEQGTDLVRAIQIQNAFPVEQNPRKKVMREALNFGAPVQDREGTVGQEPRGSRPLAVPFSMLRWVSS